MPEGPYDGENMRQTVVPGRNTLMLATAMAYAENEVIAGAVDKAFVHYGAHSGDHHIYPDCRPEYYADMCAVFKSATDGKVELSAPFMHMDKGDILIKGLAMGLDYSKTWTCYKGGEYPCGVCGSCTERQEAFAKAGVPDPLLHQGS
jgi:7-cyano-7-deazaguanine synthase